MVVALLRQSLGLAFLANWWTLFLLIPAIRAFVAAWDCYHDNGQRPRGSAVRAGMPARRGAADAGNGSAGIKSEHHLNKGRYKAGQ